MPDPTTTNNTDLGICQWFAMCANPATKTRPYPIGDVSICDRCDTQMKALA